MTPRVSDSESVPKPKRAHRVRGVPSTATGRNLHWIGEDDKGRCCHTDKRCSKRSRRSSDSYRKSSTCGSISKVSPSGSAADGPVHQADRPCNKNGKRSPPSKSFTAARQLPSFPGCNSSPSGPRRPRTIAAEYRWRQSTMPADSSSYSIPATASRRSHFQRGPVIPRQARTGCQVSAAFHRATGMTKLK